MDNLHDHNGQQQNAKPDDKAMRVSPGARETIGCFIQVKALECGYKNDQDHSNEADGQPCEGFDLLFSIAF